MPEHTHTCKNTLKALSPFQSDLGFLGQVHSSSSMLVFGMELASCPLFLPHRFLLGRNEAILTQFNPGLPATQDWEVCSPA
jgi:hypothetical protein